MAFGLIKNTSKHNKGEDINNRFERCAMSKEEALV
jgi:hypothetical protein